MTAHMTDDNDSAPDTANLGTPVPSDGTEWQQPPLLPTARWGGSPVRNEKFRQVGLMGVAQARAALAEASRRAREAAERRAA